MSEPTFIEVTASRQVSVEDINRLLHQLSPNSSPIGERELEEIIHSADSHLFILREEAKVIGMATIAIYRTPTGRKAWLEDVVVDEDFRGHQYGRLIVEKALRYVEDMGDTTLMLTSRPQRVAANRLYQECGFERKETNVYRMKL